MLNQIIPGVYLLLKRGNKLLLQRRVKGFQAGKYSIVAGSIERDEPPKTAICREAKEEVGIDVSPEDLKLVQVLYRKSLSLTEDKFDPLQPERVDIFFTTDKWTGEPKIMEKDKCDDLQWFSINELPENIYFIVKTFLEEYPNVPLYKELSY